MECRATPRTVLHAQPGLVFALVRLSLRDGSLALRVLPLDLAQHRLDVAVHTPQLIGENLWPRVSRWRRAGDASSDASHVPGGGGCASKLPTPDVVPHTRHVQRTMRASSVPTFRLGIGKYDISTRVARARFRGEPGNRARPAQWRPQLTRQASPLHMDALRQASHRLLDTTRPGTIARHRHKPVLVTTVRHRRGQRRPVRKPLVCSLTAALHGSAAIRSHEL